MPYMPTQDELKLAIEQEKKNPSLHGHDQENVQEKSRESSKTVQREIEKLKVKNVIRRVGGDKGGLGR